MDSQFDPNLEKDIQQVLADAPQPILDFFAARKTEGVTRNLMHKYQLHVDQGAILEREIILLLLGLEDLNEFSDTLRKEGQIDPQAVSNIMLDVNDQIFVPLREEMRKGPPTEVKHAEVKPPQAQSVAPQEPRASVLQPRTTIIPANPNLPPRPAEASGVGGLRPAVASGVGGSRPAQTPSITPKYVPPKKYFHLQNNKIPTAPPQFRQGYDGHSKAGDGSLTSINPAKLLEDHEEPHIDISERVQVVSPPTIQHKVYEPPPNLPGAMPPKPSNLPPTPSSKPYSSDPYREPIEP
ncbi:MAG: hypothetical protein Q8L30_00275 [bacterium]|nr:hypothetical protein [bacterium]